MTPEHHGYIWKKMVADPLWVASEEYKKADAAHSISLWQVNPQYVCQVAVHDETPLGFYALQNYAWEVGSGTHRHLLEQFRSDHTDATRLLWFDIVKRVKHDPKGVHGLFGFILEGNVDMKLLFQAKGFKRERIQAFKEL